MILCVGRYYRWCLWQEAVLPNGHWDTLIQENSGLVWMINTMTIIGMMIRRRKRHNGQRCRNTERWLRRWRLTMMMIKSKCIHNQCWNQWWKSDEAIQWWMSSTDDDCYGDDGGDVMIAMSQWQWYKWWRWCDKDDDEEKKIGSAEKRSLCFLHLCRTTQMCLFLTRRIMTMIQTWYLSKCLH